MNIPSKPLAKLTAADLMSKCLVTITADTSFHAAAEILYRHQVHGAPVVNAEGRCIGILCASDFVRWTNDGAQGIDVGPFPPCAYQVKGKLLNGDDAVICTYPIGGCPSQEVRPTIGGGHTAVCLQPFGSPSARRHATDPAPMSAVLRYMTRDLVTAEPRTSITAIARTMIDAGVHHVLIIDKDERPVGIVCSTDLVAAITRSVNEDADDCVLAQVE